MDHECGFGEEPWMRVEVMEVIGPFCSAYLYKCLFCHNCLTYRYIIVGPIPSNQFFQGEKDFMICISHLTQKLIEIPNELRFSEDTVFMYLNTQIILAAK